MQNREIQFEKDGHTYVIRYAPGREGMVIDQLMTLAEDADCNVDWLDAATLSHGVASGACGGGNGHGLRHRPATPKP